MPFGKVVLFKMWKSKREQGIYRVLNPSLKKKKGEERKAKVKGCVEKLLKPTYAFSESVCLPDNNVTELCLRWFV